MGPKNEPDELVDEIKAKRRSGQIPDQVNVAHHKHLGEVKITTDTGRVRRPLIIVENGKSKLTQEHVEKLKKKEMGWDDLIKTGVVEYLDSEEEEAFYIAL